MARIFNDSKTFVDMKLKTSEADILEKFQVWKDSFPDPTPDDVRNFVTVSINFDYFF